MENAQIANRIKYMCKLKKTTISQMLLDCEMSKSLIYDMEKREKSPSCDKMLRIANYLDCSVDYLLGRSEVLQPHQETFSQDEIELIHAYRCAEPDDKTIVNSALRKYMVSEQGKTASAG